MRWYKIGLVAGFVVAMTFLSSCKSPSDSGPPSTPPGPPSVPAGSVPLAPASINATNTTSQDTISWSAASGATSYNLYYRSTTSGVTKANGTKIAGAISPFTQTGLTNGTAYYYVVTAVNASGESPESSQVSATPIAAPTSVGLAGLMIMTEQTVEFNLAWIGVTGATSYNVYHSSSSGVTPLNGTKVSNAGVFFNPPFYWRLADGPALINEYFIVTAVNSRGESAPSSPAATGPTLLNPKRYLPTSLITHAQQTGAASSDFKLSVPNPFAEDAPIVFIGSTAPTNMKLATAYYSTGYGTNGLGCYNLADSTHNGLTMDTDVGSCTIYGLDWTFIELGKVTHSAGVFTVTGHGLNLGDTVYIAASTGNKTLASGAYLVRTTPDFNTFTLDGANIASGDSINYLAKVNSTASAVPY